MSHTSRVIVIQSDAEYRTELTKAGSKLVCVDFSAEWCGPCKMIHPHVVTLSMKYTDVVFLEVDVDKLQSVAASSGVSSMPTFHFLRGGQKIKSFSGADARKLESTIVELRGSGGGEGSSSEGGETADSASVSFKIPPGMMDLSPFIDKTQIECLNESDSHTAASLFKKSGYLASDCDSELLLFIPFNQPCKLHSLKFESEASAPAQAPKNIKLFMNVDALDFDDAESSKPLDELTLTERDFEPEVLTPLKYVKMQNVRSITLFVKDNLSDDDETRLRSLFIIGQPSASMNMSDFKRIEPDP